MFRSSTISGTTFFTMLNDFYISKSLDLYGEWSYGEIELLARLMKPDSRVVEAGAHIGSHTVFIARDLCPKGKVFAFEPRRIHFQLLCANLVANGVTHAHCFMQGVGAARETINEGQLPLQKLFNSGARAVGAIKGEGETFDVVPLDEIAEVFGRVDLIKADVQGHEIAMLRGAAGLLARWRPILYLENEDANSSRALIELVTSLDYLVYWHVVPLFRWENRGRSMQNIFGQIVSVNLVGVPRERADAQASLTGAAHLEPVTDSAWYPLGTS